MKPKLCFVVAIPETANNFLKKHIEALSNEYDIYIAADINSISQVAQLSVCGHKSIAISRKIHLIKDFIALYQLCRYFHAQQFDVVHSITPKAGFLSAIAGLVARVPLRIHTFTGQVWVTRQYFSRFILKCCDRLIAFLNTHILVDGSSQRQFLIKSHIISENKSKVLGYNSISGVDTVRFQPSLEGRMSVRKLYSIPQNAIVFSFIGRLTYDKGIRELLAAFDKLATSNKDVYLLIAGRDEDNCLSIIPKFNHIIPGYNFLYLPATDTPEKLLQSIDVLCLPSYREGFGTIVIEASSAACPVICSNIYGLKDAMVDNYTGLRCRVAESKSLYKCMKQMYQSPALRRELGNNGREWVCQYFSCEDITAAWVNFYHTLR